MSAIVITIDSIFDTRTALWTRLLNDDQLASLINSGYYTRLTDVYPKLYDPEKFRELYDNRDLTLLKESFITEGLDIVFDIYNRAMAKVRAGPEEPAPYIVITTYPYDISEDDLKDIAACVAHTTSPEIDIRFVHKDREVSKDELRDIKAIAYVTYEGERWLTSEYADGIDATTILPYTLLVTPMLKTSFNDLDDDKIIKACNVFKDDLASLICRFEWTQASSFTTVMLNPKVVGAQTIQPDEGGGKSISDSPISSS